MFNFLSFFNTNFCITIIEIEFISVYQSTNFRKNHSATFRAAGDRGDAPSEETRKFGKSFDLRFTAYSRLSARHFADDESTSLLPLVVRELLLHIRVVHGSCEIRIRKDSAQLFSSFSFFIDKCKKRVKIEKDKKGGLGSEGRGGR